MSYSNFEAMIFSVGTSNWSRNRELFYCNGIEATPDQAKEQATIISQAFGGRGVNVFYNPTKLEEYIRFDSEQKERQLALGRRLAQYILNSLTPGYMGNKAHFILLFAHSHGAFITRIALNLLNIKERQNVRVYTFGGVNMLPKHLAGEVINYVFEEDMIARTGNKGYDPEGILDRIMQIKTKMRAEKISLRQAIIHQYTQDTYLSLDPIMTALSEADPATRADKSRRFGSGFLGGNTEVFEKETVKEGIKKYIACFEKYQVEVLSRPLKQGYSPEESLDIDSMYKEAVTTMCTYGGHSLNYCHILPAFVEVIQAIAVRFLKEMEDANNDKKHPWETAPI